MKSEKPVGVHSSRQQPDCPAVCCSSSSSASASCEHRCCHEKDRFQWHHLVIVAVIAGIFPSAVFFGFLYATQLPCDCRLVVKQVERLLREQFPSCKAAAGIHLEFSIPTLDQQMIDRLQRINGSTETVEYGEISQKGFKPYADRQNGTRYSFRNWTPAKWFNSSSIFKYDPNRGTIKVLQSGLYYVYSQIRFYHTRPCSYAVMVNDETVLFKCLDGTAGEPLWQFSNCYLGGVAALKAGDQLWLRDMYGENSRLYDYYVHLDPVLGASSFWGAIHLGQL